MIDYNLLQKAISFYEYKGYQRIEVPWMVTEAVDSITRPQFIDPLEVPNKNKNLIASGEQGFLYLMLKGYLPKGKYQTLTPCFRNDPYDMTHCKNFMKLELINILDPSEKSVDEMLSTAEYFFKNTFCNSKDKINITKENNIFDINHGDIELGSYGYRKHFDMEWVFGTGIAEPRTSRILKIL